MITNNLNILFKKMKKEIKTTQTSTMIMANTNLIMLYFKLEKILEENARYGNRFIEQVSIELNLSFPNMKGFSSRNLKYMKKFYNEYVDDEKVQLLVAQLPWGHNLLLIELKATKFIPEYIGKNVSLADDIIKASDENPSIGLILCTDKDKLTVN